MNFVCGQQKERQRGDLWSVVWKPSLEESFIFFYLVALFIVVLINSR